MCYYRSISGGNDMKKIVIVLLVTIILAGCSTKENPSQTLCELKDDGPISYTYIIDANGNDVTRMENVLRMKGSNEGSDEGFDFVANEFQKAFDASKQTWAERAGKKDIPGLEFKVDKSDSMIALIQIQTMKDIDFELMNRIKFYEGYDRVVKGLFLDEEVNALQENGYTCTKK